MKNLMQQQVIANKRFVSSNKVKVSNLIHDWGKAK